MAVPKQADSQSEGEYTNPSSSFDTTTYGTASNYPSLPYPQSNTQQSTLPTDMTRYNYTQLSNYHDQYRGTSQANYPLYQTGLPVDYPQIQEDVSRVNYAHHQASPITYSQHEGLPAPLDYSQQHSQESYSTAPYDHSTATWSNLTESYNADSGMSGSTHGLAPHVQPTRYSSYPPTSYTPVTNSNYTPYPLSGLSASLSSSPSSSSDSNPLPSSSYPRSWHATTSYLPPDPHQYSPYSAKSSSAQLSTPGSTESMLSPAYSTGSVPLSSSPSGTPPAPIDTFLNTPNGEGESLLLSRVRVPSNESQDRTNHYSQREQMSDFRNALTLPSASTIGPFIPQPMYKPHTTSDRRRYVDEVELDRPIYFWMENPTECGISLSDALHSRVRRLVDREQLVFEGRGPSVSIRLEWPGYRQWSRQIPTKDFRTPPGPITKAKLAKNVAKCVQRFINERHNQGLLEDESDSRWRVCRSDSGENLIKLEDLILVSMHHVSMGSWQPQLRLTRPLAL